MTHFGADLTPVAVILSGGGESKVVSFLRVEQQNIEKMKFNYAEAGSVRGVNKGQVSNPATKPPGN